jgi:hypothetical protein
MILSRNFYFYTLSVMLLATSHFYSRSVNPYQIIIHLLSIFFIYITLFKETNTEASKKSKGCDKNGGKKNKTIVQCLQSQCINATSTECSKYARCQLNNTTCSTKLTLCENLDKTTCNIKDCMWDNKNNRCSWNQPNLDKSDYNSLYDAETYGLNTTCFKSSNPPDLNNVSLNDYVNVKDSVYSKCIEACTNDNAKCIESCKIDSAKRRKCEAADGYKFDVKRKTCDKFYDTYSNNDTSTDAIAHDHDVIGYKRAQLFQINSDNPLMYFFKALLIVIIILVNINVIIFLENYKKS